MPKKGYQDIKEEVVLKRTGKRFDEWRRVLDKFKAKKRGHDAAVDLLVNKYRVNRWWAHVIFIRYEFESRHKR